MRNLLHHPIHYICYNGSVWKQLYFSSCIASQFLSAIQNNDAQCTNQPWTTSSEIIFPIWHAVGTSLTLRALASVVQSVVRSVVWSALGLFAGTCSEPVDDSRSIQCDLNILKWIHIAINESESIHLRYTRTFWIIFTCVLFDFLKQMLRRTFTGPIEASLNLI